MNCSEYQRLAQRTAPSQHYSDIFIFLSSEPCRSMNLLRLFHSVFGMNAELSELRHNMLITGAWADVDIAKQEIGDLLWFLTNAAVSIDTTLDSVSVLGNCSIYSKHPLGILQSIEFHISSICNTVQKELFQGHSGQDYDWTMKIVPFLCSIYSDLYDLISLFRDNTTIYDIMESNIKKLECRYPSGFEAIRSANRYS